MRTVTNLNMNWQFTRDHETAAVDLPHTWNAADGQDGDDHYWRGAASYTKTLSIHKEQDLRYFLEIQGCGSSAEYRTEDGAKEFLHYLLLVI